MVYESMLVHCTACQSLATVFLTLTDTTPTTGIEFLLRHQALQK